MTVWTAMEARAAALGGFGDPLRRSDDLDLADAARIGVEDAELERVRVEHVADLGNASGEMDDEPTERIEVAVLVRDLLTEVVDQIVDEDLGGRDVATRLDLAHERLFLVVLVLDLADDLLDDVLERHDAARAAEVVGHDREVDPSDLRLRSVKLTSKGKALAEAAIGVGGQITEDTLAPLTPAERLVIVDILQKLS